jgi:hypothetical protein
MTDWEIVPTLCGDRRIRKKNGVDGRKGWGTQIENVIF